MQRQPARHEMPSVCMRKIKLLKTGHWTSAVAALLLMGPMLRPQEALANHAPELKTTAWNDDASVARLTDRLLGKCPTLAYYVLIGEVPKNGSATPPMGY